MQCNFVLQSTPSVLCLQNELLTILEHNFLENFFFKLPRKKVLSVAPCTDQHSCNPGELLNVFVKPNKTSM